MTAADVVTIAIASAKTMGVTERWRFQVGERERQIQDAQRFDVMPDAWRQDHAHNTARMMARLKPRCLCGNCQAASR